MLERTKARHIKTNNYIEITLLIPDGRESHYKIPNTDKVVGKVDAFLHKLEKTKDVASTSWEDSTPWEEVAKGRIARYTKSGLAMRGARYREGLSQKELAGRCGISQDNISKMENGKRPIGEKIAKKLAKALHADYQIFMSKSDK